MLQLLVMAMVEAVAARRAGRAGVLRPIDVICIPFANLGEVHEASGNDFFARAAAGLEPPWPPGRWSPHALYV